MAATEVTALLLLWLKPAKPEPSFGHLCGGRAGRGCQASLGSSAHHRVSGSKGTARGESGRTCGPSLLRGADRLPKWSLTPTRTHMGSLMAPRPVRGRLHRGKGEPL